MPGEPTTRRQSRSRSRRTPCLIGWRSNSRRVWPPKTFSPSHSKLTNRQFDMTDTTLPEKMPLTSMDIAEEKREQLRRCLAAVLPEIVAEDKIDSDQLKRVLGEWV